MYLSLFDYIKMAISDPYLYQHLELKHLPEALDSFHSTPYAQEPLLFTKNVRFWIGKIEYRVGDFIKLKRHKQVARIEKLDYASLTDIDDIDYDNMRDQAKLLVVVRLFVYVADAPTEVMCTHDMLWISPDQIQRKCRVLARHVYDEELNHPAHTFFCQHVVDAFDDLQDWSPQEVVWSFAGAPNGE